MKASNLFFASSLCALVGTVFSAVGGDIQTTVWAFLATWGLYFAGYFSAEAESTRELLSILDSSPMIGDSNVQ